jgi:gamma-glutamylcysteine synthetase
LLRELPSHGDSFSALALRFSLDHRRHIDAQPTNQARRQEFEAEAQLSLEVQQSIERSQKGSFDEYLASYLAN